MTSRKCASRRIVRCGGRVLLEVTQRGLNETRTLHMSKDNVATAAKNFAHLAGCVAVVDVRRLWAFLERPQANSTGVVLSNEHSVKVGLRHRISPLQRVLAFLVWVTFHPLATICGSAFSVPSIVGGACFSKLFRISETPFSFAGTATDFTNALQASSGALVWRESIARFHLSTLRAAA